MKDLYGLIHALNKADKKKIYLFLDNKQQVKSSQLSVVYFVLQQHSVFDAVKIMSDLSRENVRSKSVPFLCTILKGEILKCLRMKNVSSVTLELNEKLSNIELLFDLNLNSLVEKELNQAIKKATLHEKYDYLNIFLDWKVKFINTIKGISSIESTLDQKSDSISKTLDIYSKNEWYYKTMLHRSNINTINESEINSFSEYYDSYNQTFETKYSEIRFLQSKAAYNNLQGETNKEYEIVLVLIRIIESNKIFANDYAVDWINIWSRFLVLTRQLQPNKFYEVLNKFRASKDLFPKNKEIHKRIFLFSYASEFTNFIIKNDFKEGLVILNKVFPVFKSLENDIAQTYKFTFYYNALYLNFGAKKHTKSLELSNYIINEFKPKDRIQVYGIVEIINFLVHFELGNYFVIALTAKRIETHLKKIKRLFSLEKQIIKSILLISKYYSNNPIRSKKDEIQWQNIMDKMNPIFEEKQSKITCSIFDFKWWFNQQINRY